MPELRYAVIVGDICSTHDADKLAQSGAPVVQINTDQFGGECHLAAHVIETAVNAMDLHAIDLLIVENIGNLVCPRRIRHRRRSESRHAQRHRR
jgi:hydrogenase nickel incorporation protein HypB